MELLLQYVVPVALSGVAAYGGAWGAVRVEIRWLRQELARHDRELAEVRGRLHELGR